MTQSNGGVSSARNRALKVVSGEYITFLDADDILPELSLEARVEYMKNNPSVDLVDGHVSVRDINLENETRHYSPYYNGFLLETHSRITSSFQSKSTKEHHLKPWEQIAQDSKLYIKRGEEMGPFVKQFISDLLMYGRGYVDTRKIWGILSSIS